MKTTTISDGHNQIIIESELHVLEHNLSQIDKYFGEIAIKHTKNIVVKPFIAKMKEIIEIGGSSKRKFSWGYWERIRGGKFRYRLGKSSWFSSGWRGKSTIRYPIHPNSYFRRKSRKRPKAGQFALHDTAELLNSFMILSAFHVRDNAELTIGSLSKKLDYHEEGKSSPKRQILAPAVDWFDHNKSLHNKLVNSICSELEARLMKG